MKRKAKYIIDLTVAVVIIAVMAACEIEQKEPLYGPDGTILQHPGRVQVEQATEVQGQKYYIVDSQGNPVTTIGHKQWVDMEAGEYTLLGYSPDEYFNLTGTTLTLKNMDGTPLPENLRGGAEGFPIIEDNITQASVVFNSLTRKLRIEAELEGIGLQNITSMFATLDGLAGAIDLSKGFGAVVQGAENYTAQVEVRIVNGKLIMELNLLGVDLNADQLFNIEIKTTDGNTYNLSMSLREILESFNNGSTDFIFTINIKLSVDSQSNLNGTIIDWEEGEKVDIDGEG